MLSFFADLKGRVTRGGAAPAQRADADGAMLSVKGVTTRYGSTVAIRDIDLEIRRGEIVAILGANGAGKSTVLKTICGLLAPMEGEIAFEGEEITRFPAERVVKRGISLTPEGREVFGGLTVEENLRMGAGLSSRSTYEQRLEGVLDLFPVVREKMKVFAGLLSGGEQQQLAIARSLMSEPKLLLLDEPSLGLAPIIVERVFELIETLRERGMTLVLAEQNVEKALQFSDRAYVFSTGRVELEGSTAELRENPDVEEAYLGLGVRNGE